MATHSRILAWRIPWTEKPGRLQLMGLQEQDTTERFTHIHIWHPKIPIVMVLQMHCQYFHLENQELWTIFTIQCTRSAYLCSLS